MKVVRIATLFATLTLSPCLGLTAAHGAAPAAAPGWVTQVSSHTALPELMIGIDKDSQTFYMFTRKSPLEVIRKLPCTTGSALGDKMREGDMRTPEGVYFVEEKVPGKLLLKKSVNRLIRIECPDDIVSIPPCVGKDEVLIQPVGVGIPGNVQPVPSPPFAVGG